MLQQRGLVVDEVCIGGLYGVLAVCAVDHSLANPYHNSVHVADGLAAELFWLTSSEDVVCKFEPFAFLTCIIGAEIHDMGHPGTTSDFEICTSSHIVLQYNDTSVLEVCIDAPLVFLMRCQFETVLNQLERTIAFDARLQCERRRALDLLPPLRRPSHHRRAARRRLSHPRLSTQPGHVLKVLTQQDAMK